MRPHAHEHCHHEPHASACRDRFGSSSVFNVAECSVSLPRGLLLSCATSMSLDSALLQQRAPLPIIETQTSHWNVSGVDRRETSLFPRKKDVTVWAGECFCFFSLFTLKQVFPKCLPCATRCSASSASDLPRQLIWIPDRATTCGPSGPPPPCLLV